MHIQLTNPGVPAGMNHASGEYYLGKYIEIYGTTSSVMESHAKRTWYKCETFYSNLQGSKPLYFTYPKTECLCTQISPLVASSSRNM
jgi:hypothetical protein